MWEKLPQQFSQLANEYFKNKHSLKSIHHGSAYNYLYSKRLGWTKEGEALLKKLCIPVDKDTKTLLRRYIQKKKDEMTTRTSSKPSTKKSVGRGRRSRTKTKFQKPSSSPKIESSSSPKFPKSSSKTSRSLSSPPKLSSLSSPKSKRSAKG